MGTPLTIIEAAKNTVDPFVKGMLETISEVDQFMAMIKFVPKDGMGFSYEREKSLPDFNFVADGHTTIEDSTGSTDIVTVPIREAVGDFWIRRFSQNQQADQVASQMRMKLKAAARRLATCNISGANIASAATGDGSAVLDYGVSGTITAIEFGPGLDSSRYGLGMLKYTHVGTFWQFRAPGDRFYGAQVAAASDGQYTLYGDNPSKWVKLTIDVSEIAANAENTISFTSSANEPDGYYTVMHPNQIISATGTDGDPLSFDLLDQLIDKVDVGGDLAFVMPRALRRAYKSLQRTAGFSLDEIELPNGKRVMQYQGYPILISDFIPTTETKGSLSTLSSVLFTSLDSVEGYWWGANGGQELNLQDNPFKKSVFGFEMIDLGPNQTGKGNSNGYRLSYTGAPALGSYKAAARARQVKTTV